MARTITIIGAGGIGSNLLCALVPAIHRGGLVEGLGEVVVRVHDSDRVSEDNLAHQRFLPSQVGRHKVEAACSALTEFESDRLRVTPVPTDVRVPGDIASSDLVVVAVDSPVARRVVHSTAERWLDLRCSGDGYIAIDHRVDHGTVESLTVDQPPKSCQLGGSTTNGNIQFGYLAAAAHGAQWLLQSLRQFAGEGGAMQPLPQSASISFGTLGRLVLEQEAIT